jgi:hypothetical protein
MAWLVKHWDGGQSMRLVALVPNMQKLARGCGYLARYRCFCEFFFFFVGWGKKKNVNILVFGRTVRGWRGSSGIGTGVSRCG